MKANETKEIELFKFIDIVKEECNKSIDVCSSVEQLKLSLLSLLVPPTQEIEVEDNEQLYLNFECLSEDVSLRVEIEELLAEAILSGYELKAEYLKIALECLAEGENVKKIKEDVEVIKRTRPYVL